jgi:hypothetical protein
LLRLKYRMHQISYPMHPWVSWHLLWGGSQTKGLGMYFLCMIWSPKAKHPDVEGPSIGADQGYWPLRKPIPKDGGCWFAQGPSFAVRMCIYIQEDRGHIPPNHTAHVHLYTKPSSKGCSHPQSPWVLCRYC